MISSSLETSSSQSPFQDPAFVVVSFWDIDVVRSVRTKGENEFKEATPTRRLVGSMYFEPSGRALGRGRLP